MNLKQLEYFVHVAGHGSFSRAATVLDIAQPALSRQIRSLEAALNEQLFVRDGRGVSLTDAGMRLLEHSTAILQLVTHARADLCARRDEPSGRVSIGLPPSLNRLMTLPLIKCFKSQFPNARLSIVEGLSTNIIEWVMSGRVDLALAYNPEAQPGLDIVPLRDEALGLVSFTCTSLPQKRRLKGKSLPLKDLIDYPLIVPERMHAMRRLLETQAALAGVKLDIAWEVSSIPAIVELVRAGYGHAVLTATGLAALNGAGDLVLRPLVEPEIVNVLCVVSSASKRQTPLALQTASLLRQIVDQIK